MEIINIPCTSTNGALPVYQSEAAAGADIMAANEIDIVLKPGCWELIPTGLRIALPPGYEVQVRPRSGLAAKFGVTVLNSPGTIDADYRGEIKVILINHSKESFVIHKGDRIAQLVMATVVRAVWKEEENLTSSKRGENGFGSTGISSTT